jgi:hypothetical protein
MKAVENAPERHTRNVVLDNIDNLSLDVRVIVAKSMLARYSLPQNLLNDFYPVVVKKKNDQSGQEE